MWSRKLFIVWILALTILTTQSHDIHKRGLLSRLFGGSSKSTRNFERDLPPRERSKARELLKNPVVIATLSAVVAMLVQKALANRGKNMKDLCENKYVQMADQAGNISPQIQEALKLLGCDTSNNRNSSSTIPNNRFSTTKSPFSRNDNDEEEANNQEEDEEGTLETSLPREKESRIQQLLAIARREKGAKRNFLRSLFGLKKKDKTFKKGHKLPSSSYTLDKDDANTMKDLDKELEEFNKSIND